MNNQFEYYKMGRYWQIAAGDGGRDYSEIFLRFGVILVGPGSVGDYFENIEKYNDKNDKRIYRSFIKPFAEELKKDDIIVLKKPNGKSWEIIAVGKISDEKYKHQETFSDVEGWDLQHCREVNWRIPKNKTLVDGLRRGTLSRVFKKEVISVARKIYEQGTKIQKTKIPAPVDEITIDDLIDSIMEIGLTVNDSELISSTIWKLRRLAKWYMSKGEEVGEYEIRSFLIVPLLTALGWAEQKIKIEWKNIDVAIFSKPYSKLSQPKIVIESKRLWDGLLYADNQVRRYVSAYNNCNYFIVSDGIRYKLFEKVNKKWKFTSYMNLLSPKIKHPYFESVGGAVDFFTKIIPTA